MHYDAVDRNYCDTINLIANLRSGVNILCLKTISAGEKMTIADNLKEKYITTSPRQSNYFAVVHALLAEGADPEKDIDAVYKLIAREIGEETIPPETPVKFGTSGWRGILGKEINCRTVEQVTLAICGIYSSPEDIAALSPLLMVKDPEQARQRGCLIGHDNRFGGETMARRAAGVLSSEGFTVHYAGESSTGVLSAALIELNAAFSINLTPSHNPLDYGGFKFNAADGGPAQPELTEMIGERSREIIARGVVCEKPYREELIHKVDSLDLWRRFVRRNKNKHRLDLDEIMARLAAREDMIVVADSVHGVSRIHLKRLFGPAVARLIHLRDNADVTFGGVAPEPSSANMRQVSETLRQRPEPLKLGLIIDPDADRVRFTDGGREIDMNFFGAMAFHFLHQHKGLMGMAAKNVGTSNFVNRIAAALGEEVAETKVGFKEFKPYLNRALVVYEESDGISIIGHTPEKDSYIGLLLALDMTMSLGKNLSACLADLENQYGAAFPGRGSVETGAAGDKLKKTLAQLEDKTPGATIIVSGEARKIRELITIDGYKIVFSDESWLMIRPSGTEPKVRFYVEGNSAADRDALMAAASETLKELGL